VLHSKLTSERIQLLIARKRATREKEKPDLDVSRWKLGVFPSTEKLLLYWREPGGNGKINPLGKGSRCAIVVGG